MPSPSAPSGWPSPHRPPTPAVARLSPSAAEELCRDVPHPSPATERERLLVYAVIYQAHDNRRRNRVSAHEICELIAQHGPAPFLRRAGGALTPIETVTAHYAPTHTHPAWQYRLTPMTATAAFKAVRHDPKASRELIEAARGPFQPSQ
jgi:hypothetical protein